MSATERTATVLADRDQDGATVYMPNLRLFNQFFCRTSAGTYTSSSHAALAYDLLACQRALGNKKNLTSLRDLELHHKLSWLQSQPLFLPLLEGSFEDLCKTLRNDPSILETAFPRTRGPQGSLKVKMETVQSSSSESSLTSEEKEPSPERASRSRAAAAPAAAKVDETRSFEDAELFASPEEEELQQDPRSPPLSSGNKVVRTNWANFPLNSSSQSVMLTKFQISSGVVSVPLGRAHSVLGAFSKSCTVTLQCSKAASSSSSSSPRQNFECGYKLYQSQPTQVFLTKLKPLFTASGAKTDDVLTLSEVSPGICAAEIWQSSSPPAAEFKSLLKNGWSDVSPPLKNPISPPQCIPTTEGTEKRGQRGKKRSAEPAEKEEKESESPTHPRPAAVENATTTRRTRKAPRRFIIYSSSENDEDEEFDADRPEANPKPETIKPQRKRLGRPPNQQAQQQQQPGAGIFDEFKEVKPVPLILSSLPPRGRNTMPSTTITRTAVNTMNQNSTMSRRPLPLVPPPGSHHRTAADTRQSRRSPAKKPRTAAYQQATPLIVETERAPLPLFVAPSRPLKESTPVARKQQQQEKHEQKQKKRPRASRSRSLSRSPKKKSAKRHRGNSKVAKTPRSSGGGGGAVRGNPNARRLNRAYASSRDDDKATDSEGSTACGSASCERTTRKPGGRYLFRSDVALNKLRRARRKGIPARSPEGEPNLHAYYASLAFVDSLFKI